MTSIEAVRHNMRQFGVTPKCHTTGGQWLMVYENSFAPMSRRHLLGTYSGDVELYSVVFPSELAARKEFERRACEF